MEIIIESPHFTVNSLLEAYINKRVERLSHLNDQLLRGDVLLKLDKSDTDDNKICEIKIHAPRKNFFAISKCSTFEDAVADTIHSLEKQMRKQKTKFSKTKEKLEMPDIAEEESE